ncbi:MAG: hypothetical protein MAG715_00865 [Methanonatronarchaeales archaeon]|nr:hypothetical protein [Methanonatronarchaeales archaeon]
MNRDRVQFLLTAAGLKDEERTGWGLSGVESPESVADHSWGTALLCLLHAEDAYVDPGRAVAMALVHDLLEAETGDLLPGTEDKRERERAALDAMFPDDEGIRGLLEEYATGETEIARFVKDMDLCEMCLQALKYREEERNDDPLDEFLLTAEPRLNTDTGRGLFRAIRARYGDGA